ncbi:MAG: cupin domain-containing protein [Clostridia bacterium]|nr:cupin domain-containing protein [Clostridia bacterium]
MDQYKKVPCWKWKQEKPDWCRYSDVAVRDFPLGASESYTFCDWNEYYIITGGSAEIRIENQLFEISAGDIVAIPAGDAHCIERVTEPLTYALLCDRLQGKERKKRIAVPEECIRRFIGPEGRYEDGYQRSDELPAVHSVILKPRTWFWLNQKPFWSDLVNLSAMTFHAGESEMDYHRHECDEIYIVTKGSVTVRIEGDEFPLVKGECVPMKAGTNHQVANADCDSIVAFAYDKLQGLKRYGHLHDGEQIWILNE